MTTSATMNPEKLGCCTATKVRSKVQPLVSAAVKEEKLGQWHFHWHEMKALISSDYFKSTVDLRRHRSGVMKPSCVLPAFGHRYAHVFKSLAHAETVLSPCLTPIGTNLLKPQGQEEQEVHSQAHLLKLEPPSQCTGVSTSAGQHRRRGFMLAVAEMPTAYSTPNALPPVPIINQSSLPFTPVPVSLTVVSLLNLSAL